MSNRKVKNTEIEKEINKIKNAFLFLTTHAKIFDRVWISKIQTTYPLTNYNSPIYSKTIQLKNIKQYYSSSPVYVTKQLINKKLINRTYSYNNERSKLLYFFLYFDNTVHFKHNNYFILNPFHNSLNHDKHKFFCKYNSENTSMAFYIFKDYNPRNIFKISFDKQTNKFVFSARRITGFTNYDLFLKLNLITDYLKKMITSLSIY